MKMLNYLDILTLRDQDSSRQIDGKLFALIDHAGMPGLSKKLSSTGLEWISLFEGSKDEGALTVAPLLFPVDVHQDSLALHALLKWICEQGTYTSSILFLSSPLSMRDLARRLARRLDASLPDDVEIFLRYFDTRVFEKLSAILSEQQKSTFLSLASCWWFVDRRGELQKLSSNFSEDESVVSPLAFTTEQEAALLDASEPDQVADLLRTSVPKEFLALPLGSRHDFVVRNLGEARSIGIEATHELALYCALALSHGESFIHQEPWISKINFVKAGKLSIIEAVDAVEAAE